MCSQLFRDTLHEVSGGPWLLEEIVQRVDGAVHEVLLLMIHCRDVFRSPSVACVLFLAVCPPDFLRRR